MREPWQIEIGELRHRIRIQQDAAADSTRSTTGQHVPDWETVPTLTGKTEHWAKVEPLHGRELDRAQQVVALATHRITLRYRRGVKEHMRAAWVQVDGTTRTFNFESVKDVMERREKLEILCTEAKES